MFPCPDFVRKLLEYFHRYFSPIIHTHDEFSLPHDHDGDYAEVSHAHSEYATDQELTDGLGTKANTSHSHTEYATDQELSTGLATKASASHTHTAKQIMWHAMTGGSWDTSGTGNQVIPNLLVVISPLLGVSYLRVDVHLPFYCLSGTNPNIVSYVMVWGTSYPLGQWRVLSSGAGESGWVGGFVIVPAGSGNQSIAVAVTPITGVFRMNNETWRNPKIIVTEI
jgi:hypothetical protein